MEVRLYDRNIDAEKLKIFNAHVFGESNSADNRIQETALKNPYGDTPGPTAIAISGDKIVGHLTSTPFSLWMNNEEKIAYWVSGFHVLPETRGTGVGKKLVTCLTEALPILSAVLVVEPSLRAFQANDWQFPGKIHEYIHLVNPKALNSILTVERVDRFLPKALKAFASPLLSLSRIPAQVAVEIFKRLHTIKKKIQLGREQPFNEREYFDSHIDRLWDGTKADLGLTHVRSATYINWFFPNHRGWKKRICERNGQVTAWLLYTVKHYSDNGPLHGLTALNIVDALWNITSLEETELLVAQILALGYDNKVDLILVSGNLINLRIALRNAAFLQLPSTVYTGFYSDNMPTYFSEAFGDAYITRGYADAAGGLAPQ